MVTKGQMGAIGRFERHDTYQFVIEAGWPDGVHVYPVARNGKVQDKPFYWSIDAEGIIRTQAGEYAKWDLDHTIAVRKERRDKETRPGKKAALTKQIQALERKRAA